MRIALTIKPFMIANIDAAVIIAMTQTSASGHVRGGKAPYPSPIMPAHTHSAGLIIMFFVFEGNCGWSGERTRHNAEEGPEVLLQEGRLRILHVNDSSNSSLLD